MANRGKARISRRETQIKLNALANVEASYHRQRSIESYSHILFDSNAGWLEKLRAISPRKICLIGAGSGTEKMALEELLGRPGQREFEFTSVEPYRPSSGDNVRNRMESMSELASESHDVAIATHVHNYTLDKIQALVETHRILRPNGVALITINPFAPIVFSYNQKGKRHRSLTVQLGHVVEFLKSKGHDIEVVKQSPANCFQTLWINKNKPRLGMNARFLEGLDWEKAGGNEMFKWAYPNSDRNLEQAAHYSTSKREINELEKFMEGKPSRYPQKWN